MVEQLKIDWSLDAQPAQEMCNDDKDKLAASCLHDAQDWIDRTIVETEQLAFPDGYRTVIAGGRDYVGTPDDEAWLDTLPIKEVVCGGAHGADAFGKDWADKRGIPVKPFPADWATYGRSAGPIRNRQMAKYADAVVLFPGGRGTEDMRRQAELHGLRFFTRCQQDNAG